MSPSLLIFSLICLLLPFSSVNAQQEAPVVSQAKPTAPQSPKPAAKTPKTQVAVIAIEGAAVYQFANFDSPVIEYVKAGTKVIASIRPRVGIGGFGAFYRVKLPSGKLGWIADVDLTTQFKDDPKTKNKTDVNPDFEALKEEEEMKGREEIYFEKYIGGSLGMVQFSEKFDGRELSSDVPVFGFRAVGPGLIGDGPPLDFSFLFSIEAPDHYTAFANGPATGFFVLTDVILPFPIMETKKSLFGLGLGPMLTYTNFQVAVRDTAIDSQEIRIGAVSSLNYMYRFSNFAVRLDGKYYFEKTDYLGFYFSFLFFRK